jgi:hypothetical protein
MSSDGEARDSKNLFLQALKGQITIHFVDGDTLEGEFLSQDELNIFLKIHDEPIMIPRSQIRFIRGISGQRPEPDQQVETKQPGLVEQDLAGSQVETLDDDTDETVVLADEADELIDETMVIEETQPLPSDDHLEDATFKLQDVGVAFDDDEDPTLVFKEETVEVDETEDKTFVLEEKGITEISAHLDCTTGPHAGQVFQLTSGTITIGRASDNILSLPNDKEISRKHSKIVYEAGNFIIEDQNSLNGTFVNDERIESPRYLEDGDLILVGVSTFVFHK